MKNDPIFLYSWRVDCPDIYVDIPWPEVHRIVSIEEIQWLRQQTTDQCQMIVETVGVDHRLYVEFYCDKLRKEYALLFAK